MRLKDKALNRGGLWGESPRQTVTTNPQKSVDAIVVPALKLVGGTKGRAYRQVKTNKGSGGIDRMEVDQPLPYLREHEDEMTEVCLGDITAPIPKGG